MAFPPSHGSDLPAGRNAALPRDPWDPILAVPRKPICMDAPSLPTATMRWPHRRSEEHCRGASLAWRAPSPSPWSLTWPPRSRTAMERATTDLARPLAGCSRGRRRLAMDHAIGKEPAQTLVPGGVLARPPWTRARTRTTDAGGARVVATAPRTSHGLCLGSHSTVEPRLQPPMGACTTEP